MSMQNPVMQTGERGWSEMDSNQLLDVLSRERRADDRPATTESVFGGEMFASHDGWMAKLLVSILSISLNNVP